MRISLAAIWEGAFKLTFSALVVAAALSSTILSSRYEFSTSELRALVIFGIAVGGALLIISQTMALRSKSAANAALAVVTLASVFTAYVVHTELYFQENTVALLAVCGAALFGLFVAFRVIDESRWGGPALSAVALIGVLWLFWPDLVDGISTPGGMLSADDPRLWASLIGICGAGLLTLLTMARFVDQSHWGGAALLAVVSIGVAMVAWASLDTGGPSGRENWTKPPGIRPVTFEETPNVYFVVFDSIVPASIMHKYIGLETTVFHGMFDREARRFRNLFANSIMTKDSLNTLMALDQDIFLAGRGPKYVSGQNPSPLIWIMRENGYETTSIFESFYFGHFKGPYIDNYVVNRELGGVCALLDEDVRKWAFWGYCRFTEAVRGEGSVVSRGDFVIRELTSVGGNRPQFVIAHFYLPGHTGGGFSYPNRGDKERFAEQYYRRANKAAVYLDQIIQHVRISDPTAILFVFGDHGMRVSRGVEFDDDPTFYLQDRFGVLGGVFPHERCGPYFDDAESKDYMTILDAVHAILACLSGGQSALLEPRYDRFVESGVPIGDEYHYEEFLYE